ncbi:hypothetical protein PNIG_b0217 [Pseudoalteromonas nigrifaciens]|uniref:Uncharacterized protein n=1 Tax=Pseudoalteromonas nigrifaciens TaxID=28109 RepID=A0AAC9XZJ9_9GAMM|nr:hypothetical protein PNIG_b0217 [Pseudoalteromonas nigrifaciens]
MFFKLPAGDNSSGVNANGGVFFEELTVVDGMSAPYIKLVTSQLHE